MVGFKVNPNGCDWSSPYCFGVCFGKRKLGARSFKLQLESIEYFLMATGSIGLPTCLAGESNFFVLCLLLHFNLLKFLPIGGE
jgi:hypothetical protein